ncbi:chaperone modulator CbpM [Limobrevibacterium gyesilva]|uniref:Chaperone modulator CbpM n=1 Tax=Limobrevibacterium gyesilva TaxID=2991712 RepID=A0AA42CJW8_9PROT|nr:chaperone modulator CbpM [Limobrevibacterium gyesilva]MCW3477317.1 chaperone modulator CbpM [Limobrevibacterium gyesilva]
MMRLDAVVALFPDLDAVELSAWIERRWVRPDQASGNGWVFTEIDIARVRLVRDLRHEMDIAEDTIPLVLALMDQVYDLRRTLAAMARAIEDQPPDIRDAVLAALRRG